MQHTRTNGLHAPPGLSWHVRAVGTSGKARRSRGWIWLCVVALLLLAGQAAAQVQVAPLGRDHPAHGEVEGVVVTFVAPGSHAGRCGLLSGDVITHFNKQPITSPQEFRSRMSTAPVVTAVTVWREGDVFLIMLRRAP